MSADIIDSEVEDFLSGLKDEDGAATEGIQGGAAAAQSVGGAASPAAGRSSTQRRQEKRLRVNWRVAMICGEGPAARTFFGKALDISLDGMSINCADNVNYQGTARVMLEIPTYATCGSNTFVEVQSKPIYSVLSGGCFQIGVQFLSFLNGSKSVLELHLNSLH